MLLRIAVAVYACWALLLIAQQPGLQYDEALLAADAVHMLRSPAELTLPHDPDTWVCPGRRCFPLMTVRYIGPIKALLCLPLFRAFGANPVLLRVVSMLLGLIGVWGLGALVGEVAGKWAGGAAALALAFHPTYVQMTVFDNNAIAAMMAALGLLCFAIRGYLRQRSVWWAFWIGASMGLGIWARANYLWFLIALAVSAIMVLRRRLPVRHGTAWLAGGILAGMPFLIYQVLSHGGTWQGLTIFEERSGLWQRVHVRLTLLAELLWTDREHRAMWAGPELGEWSRWLFLGIVLLACIAALAKGTRWARIAALTFVVLTLIMLPARLQLSEHHLILMLPVAVVVTVLACVQVRREVGLAVALLYFASACYWQIAAVRGLANTGGVGMWSDAIYDVSEYLEAKYPNQPIYILDWGLGFNLYVLSQGRLAIKELYDQPRDWKSFAAQGGVFVTTTDNNRQFLEASQGFLKATTGVPRSVFQQQDGAGFAQVIEIKR